MVVVGGGGWYLPFLNMCASNVSHFTLAISASTLARLFSILLVRNFTVTVNFRSRRLVKIIHNNPDNSRLSHFCGIVDALRHVVICGQFIRRVREI